MNSDNESLYNEIASLQAENRKLRVKAGELGPEDGEPVSGSGTSTNPRTLAVYAGVLLLAGFLAGIFVLDWMHRRRHGGFRV